MSTVGKQGLAPLVVAENIAKNGISTTIAKGADVATDTLNIGGKVFTRSSKTCKAPITAVRALGSVKPKGFIAKAGGTRRIYQARAGTTLKKVTLIGKVVTMANDASDEYVTAYFEDFIRPTSAIISAKINRSFNPILRCSEKAPGHCGKSARWLPLFLSVIVITEFHNGSSLMTIL